MVEPLDLVVETLNRVPPRYWLALGVLLTGVGIGVVVGAVNRRLLRRVGVPGAVEGTAFERTLRDFGTSTVAVIARLSMYFLWGLAVILALTVAELKLTGRFWPGLAAFLPKVFVAVLVLIVGILVGDKLELIINERLTGFKVPQVTVLAPLAKYSVLYVAVLLAIAQLGIAVGALVVLLAVYFFGLLFLVGVAFRDLLASGAAGVWLLLHEPYGIGDRVRIGDREGIVQEVEVFVTHVEDERGTEYVLPNRTVFKDGFVRIRS
jgi:small-conductance mechanosensitive channel